MRRAIGGMLAVWRPGVLMVLVYSSTGGTDLRQRASQGQTQRISSEPYDSDATDTGPPHGAQRRSHA